MLSVQEIGGGTWKLVHQIAWFLRLYPYKQIETGIYYNFFQRRRSGLPGGVWRQRLSAGINTALEQIDGTIHADGDTPARDVKTSSDLLVGESLVHAQLDDLAAGSWQKINHFPEQDKQFSFLGKNLRIPGRGFLALKRILSATDPLCVVVLGCVGDDPIHPGAGLGTVKADMIDGLEDLDPTGLKDIVG